MILGPGVFRTSLPKDFLASGVNCGVRRYRPDLGLIISKQPCVAAGVFTQNTCKAAPVIYSASILPATNIKAIITNSGQANTAIGKQGEIDNKEMVDGVAKHLKIQPKQVLAASTGVIGEPLSIAKIVKAIPKLVNNTTGIAEKFATAILTTDLVPKTVCKEVMLSTGKIHITGICKGSGMIHPNMATMLGYLLTDAVIPVEYAQKILSIITNNSFNMISVDGEMSTNDSVFLLANGASKVGIECDDDYQLLLNAFMEVAITLAKSIVRDGEGATKLIEVNLNRAPSEDIARHAARSLTMSSLIKAAVYGESPNWGRIIARLGAEQLPTNVIEKCTIMFQEHLVFSNNKQLLVNTKSLQQQMKQDTIKIDIDLNSGAYHATAWGCDLSEKYVEINAEYIT